MLYLDHGLGEPFTSSDKYFGHNLDRDALTYLAMANKLAHECGNVVTIAEDVSGLPGLAAPSQGGGFGFDYRLAMGVPDLWTNLLKTKQDNEWHIETIVRELTNRRSDEKTISYAESHDQALVGDQTIIFRLLNTLIYDCMRVDQRNHLVDRGMALHRLIRFITLTTAGHGYLNFMGNEFGHPEWIDFPRPGNNWSYHHARRLWHLRDNHELQYHKLADFDGAMLWLVKEHRVLQDPWAHALYFHVDHQIACYRRAELLFFFSFNPSQSFPDYSIPAPEGAYELIFNTDTYEFGGNGRLTNGHRFYAVPIQNADGSVRHEMKVYLPTRTAFVLKRV
jgi:1,4-alpha-glucan branching enzyme